MTSFLSKFNIRSQNRKNRAISRQKLNWVDENDPRIHYVISKKSKSLTIKIDNSKRLAIVVVPDYRFMIEMAPGFVRSKYDWILVQLESLPPPQPFNDGGVIMFKGENYHLHNPGGRARPYIDHEGKTLIISAPNASFANRTKRFLIRQARKELQERTEIHAAKLAKTVSKISVRDQSSRWGSCSRRNGQIHISYSWRLICAPPFVLDYLCAHECAHIVHMDHSKAFWQLCDELTGSVAEAEKWLKKHSARLYAVGAEF